MVKKKEGIQIEEPPEEGAGAAGQNGDAGQPDQNHDTDNDQVDLDEDDSTGNDYELLMDGIDQEGRSNHHQHHLQDSPCSVSLSLPGSFDEPLDFPPFLPGPATTASSLRLSCQQQQQPPPPSQLPSHLLSARLLELEAQVEHLQHGRALIEGHLRHEREQATLALHQVQKKWAKEVEKMRRSQAELQEQLRLAKLRNDDQRAPFRHLEISEALYQELSRRPEDELSLREFVAMRTHAQIRSVKAELEKTRKRFEEAQEKIASIASQLEVRVEEAERARRSVEARETGLRQRADLAEERLSEVEGVLEQANNRLKAQAEKERSADALQARLTAAEKEINELRGLADKQASALESATASEKTLQTRVADLSHHNEILAMDKQFLTKELESVLQRADVAQRELDRTQEKNRDLKRRKEELMQQLHDVREQAKVTYEEKLGRELQRLRDDSSRELSELKYTTKEALERENKALRDARREAMEEAERLHVQLDELNKAHEDLVFRLSRGEAAFESSLAELRGEVKIKTFELSRLGVSFEEKSAALRQAERTVLMLKSQLDLHREEFSRLETSFASRTNELTLALESEREKIRAYEDLESQLDDAIVRTGIAAAASSSPYAAEGGGCGSAAGLYDLSAGGFEGLPTASSRRMRHALQLAHKLGDRERELANVRRQLNVARTEVEKLEKKSSELEQVLEHATQPGRYVVELVREKDRELEEMRERVVETQIRAEGAEDECRQVREDKADLQRDLERLISQRQELRVLRILMQEIQARETAAGAPSLSPRPVPSQSNRASSFTQSSSTNGVVRAVGGGGREGRSGSDSIVPAREIGVDDLDTTIPMPLKGSPGFTSHGSDLEFLLLNPPHATPRWHSSLKTE